MGSTHAGGATVLAFIVKSLSKSPSHHPEMTEMLLKYKHIVRPEFFYFLVLGSADPNFWKSRIKIKLGSKSFIFILSADRLVPSTNEIKARTIF